ncbi:MAG: hypothetical protein JO185_17635 [Acidobacteriaceae bacterium]|nr:hypothetical protein [Acidobacteriaceae bacterium]
MSQSTNHHQRGAAQGKRLAFMSIAFAVTFISLAGSFRTPLRVHADDDEQDEWKVRRGFEIAPVPLNLKGKDRYLVGLGSYIVNAQIPCNDCHTQNGATEFIPTGNPYFLGSIFSGRKQINPATYLGGGHDFGPLIPGSAHIISRNLTPDKTGRPEGGHTFEEFREILRTGVDFDHLHPTCSGSPDESCIPPPFNGDLLQIMPWPEFQDMTEGDIRAIYEYLSAVPCVAGPPAPNPLHNDCH